MCLSIDGHKSVWKNTKNVRSRKKHDIRKNVLVQWNCKRFFQTLSSQTKKWCRFAAFCCCSFVLNSFLVWNTQHQMRWTRCCCYRCSFYILFVIGLWLGQNDSGITKNTVKTYFPDWNIIWSIITFESRFSNDCRCTRLILDCLLFFPSRFLSQVLETSISTTPQFAVNFFRYEKSNRNLNLKIACIGWMQQTFEHRFFAVVVSASISIYYSCAYQTNVYEMYDCGL